MTKRIKYGNMPTHLRLSDKALEAYCNIVPLNIYEQEKDGKYFYKITGAIETNLLSETELLNTLEMLWDNIR